MAIVASELVHQAEVEERIGRLRAQFADDPDIAGFEYRFGQDWSGDDAVYITMVLRAPKPSDQLIRRLVWEVHDEISRVMRSQELGLLLYIDLVSPGEHD
jgi:hypothetical protein